MWKVLSPTTQRTFHQLHSKPPLPGAAFFCALVEGYWGLRVDNQIGDDASDGWCEIGVQDHSARKTPVHHEGTKNTKNEELMVCRCASGLQSKLAVTPVLSISLGALRALRGEYSGLAPSVGPGVLVGAGGVEITGGVLLADPGEERLKLGGVVQGGEIIKGFGELGVGVGRVELLVAGSAERGAVFGAAALLARGEVVQRDQPSWDMA